MALHAQCSTVAHKLRGQAEDGRLVNLQELSTMALSQKSATSGRPDPLDDHRDLWQILCFSPVLSAPSRSRPQVLWWSLCVDLPFCQHMLCSGNDVEVVAL